MAVNAYLIQKGYILYRRKKSGLATWFFLERKTSGVPLIFDGMMGREGEAIQSSSSCAWVICGGLGEVKDLVFWSPFGNLELVLVTSLAARFRDNAGDIMAWGSSSKWSWCSTVDSCGIWKLKRKKS